MSSSEIYTTIRLISNKYSSGHPPIHIDSIAEEMGLSKDMVSQHVKALKTLKVIEFMGSENEVVVLNDSDEYANLPMETVDNK